MKQSLFTILENTALTRDVFRMILAGDTSAITNCGQFVNILLDGFFLRRPISVCDYDEKTLTLVYKVVGQGTEKMSGMEPGEKLDITDNVVEVFKTIYSEMSKETSVF